MRLLQIFRNNCRVFILAFKAAIKAVNEFENMQTYHSNPVIANDPFPKNSELKKGDRVLNPEWEAAGQIIGYNQTLNSYYVEYPNGNICLHKSFELLKIKI